MARIKGPRLGGRNFTSGNLEGRRIRSGAYGRPKRVPVYSIFTGAYLGWAWATPKEPDVFFSTAA